MMDRAVIALGGNTLVKPGENGSEESQLKRIQKTMEKLEGIVKGNSAVLTHGNGPQVGNLLLQQEAGSEKNREKKVPQLPLDTCVAMTQGQIGSYIEKSTGVNTVSIVTQVEVDSDDPAFEDPSKPIGPYYNDEPKEEDKEYIEEPEGWRRIVPSPEPQRIVEIKEIKSLLDRGFKVVACGGGGIPVKRKEKNRFEGVEAVIDKDKASALLGKQLNADKLFMITDVPYVYRNYGTDDQEKIEKIHATEIYELMKDGEFGEGSMKPKIKSALRFLGSGGSKVVITNIDNADKIPEGEGTIIT